MRYFMKFWSQDCNYSIEIEKKKIPRKNMIKTQLFLP